MRKQLTVDIVTSRKEVVTKRGGGTKIEEEREEEAYQT